VTVAAATNHITSAGYAYDANGNMTNDGTNTLVYDAESKAVSATNQSASGTYTFDGNGLREIVGAAASQLSFAMRYASLYAEIRAAT
jgi:hypothetical protein